MHHLLKQQ